MNKDDAKRIARSGITWGQIKAMLERAMEAGADDESQQSRVNPSFSKFDVFNMVFLPVALGHDDDAPVKDHGILAARNMLWEFGDFWEG